jgi:predicted RNA binding protein YcfA (HicA-like mRNA interferase family)
MPRLPRVTAADVIRVLERHGFSLDRQKGGHKIFLDAAGKRVTVPYHAGKTLRPKTLKSILKDANWTVADFVALLK